MAKFKDNWHLWLAGAILAILEYFFHPFVYVKYAMFVAITCLLIAWVAVPYYFVVTFNRQGWPRPEWLMRQYDGGESGMIPGLAIAVTLPYIFGYLIAYLLLLFV